jgi:hypothetical protein
MSLTVLVNEYLRSMESKPPPKKRKVMFVNVKRFTEADIKRKQLLELVPEQFDYDQATIAWEMDYSKAKAQIAKMRKWQLVTSEKNKNRNIFTKVRIEHESS